MFREQIEKDQQQQNYQNLHAQGDTGQAQSDLATNVADKAIRTTEENEKSGKCLAYTLYQILINFLLKKENIIFFCLLK